ncbi:glutamine synthetase family protein [Xanthobacter agilis]|uniref:Glutamine synthetase n=1 Tax=Xanthobacter agilis TaxID=47492 RepID=A0ABU0LHV8_XANAG|nr:glutamine synthetase family protein [Xanthobacter agilis]MDQ0506726.1 glutamine synthetase [Xanthobacter agilis]
MKHFQETDVFREISDPLRQERVARVREKIDRLGVEYIYYQYVTITGRVLGKAVPARHWEQNAKKGIQTWIGGVADLTVDITGTLIGFSANDGECLALPDPETFCQLPWEKKVARVFCTLFYGLEDPKTPGAYYECDTRGNLKRFDREFRLKHDGLHLRVGMEPEMLWLRPTGDAKRPYEGITKASAYHIDQFESVRPVWMQVYEYAQAMGLDMIQGDVEDAPGLLELNFAFDDALATCDRLTTYRQICAEVARQHGLVACFMAKPMMGVPANGCHHNCSVWTGGERRLVPLVKGELPGMDEVFTYTKGGVNAFENTEGGWLPTELGHHVLGGALKHIGALTALGATTVNSYRRFADLGLWAPVGANWGLQNRSCSIRISAPDRFEFRAVDAMVNQHLFCSALLKAMDDGIENKIDPGAPESRNVVEVMKAGTETIPSIPLDLHEALEALKADDLILKAMPGRLYELYDKLKRDDWRRFLKEVTDWDLNRYMHHFP